MRQRVIGVVAGLALFLGVCGLAVAQGGGGMSPEKQEAAWALQAEGVAKTLGLDAEKSKKLVDAYKANRKAQQELPPPEGQDQDRRARFEARAKANEEARGKLKTELSAFLDEAQTTKAMASLGTYNRQWDRMVDVLAGFKLDGDKQQKGLELISAYVVESAATMEKARSGGGDMQAVRDAMQKQREALDTGMAGILSAEQVTQWKENTAMRRGGGGGVGRGGEGGGAPGGGSRRERDDAGGNA